MARRASAEGEALIVYGGGHLQRKQQATNYQMDNPLAQTVIRLLERAGVKTFVIVTAGNAFLPAVNADSWVVPSLALVRETTLGAEAVSQGALPRVVPRNGKFVPIPRSDWITLPLEDQFDAVLYLGPASARTTLSLSRTICESQYLNTRLAHMELAGDPQQEADRLKQFCAD